MNSIIKCSARAVSQALALAGLAIVAALAACSTSPMELTKAERPLSNENLMLLGKKGINPSAPMFVRIFKEESEFEVWKARDDGRFYHFKTYPICNWSGDIGPKIAKGDKQAPEGFYLVQMNQLNPNSQYHLSFNLGYPNAYDRAWGRTGEALMVHGDCRSAGCYAMTDALVEEIYALARESLRGGQTAFHVHAYPFRMTAENMERVKKHKHAPFWAAMKQGYDHFENYRVPPDVAVCERRYVVNVTLPPYGLDPAGRCPQFDKPILMPFTPNPSEQHAEERIRVPGVQLRALAAAGNPGLMASQMSGVTRAPYQTPMPSPVLGFDQ
jgi:murein L,D-transpeptidase YafK